MGRPRTTTPIDCRCPVCDRPYQVAACEAARGNGKFCSKSCALKHRHNAYPKVGENHPRWRGGIAHADVVRAYKKRNPDKVRAYNRVEDAQRRGGKLKKQPCEICGSPTVDAHHDDYTKPLEVRWLCKRHHQAIHVAFRKSKNLKIYNPTN